MQTLKKLCTVQATLILLLFTSCATSKYTYYYSVLKQNDNQTENKFEKDKLNNYSQYPIHNLLSDTASNNNAVQYLLRISDKYATIRVENRIPIFIDCEKSYLTINHSKYKFSEWLYKPSKYSKINELFDEATNVLPINPQLAFDRKNWNENYFLKEIPIDSLVNYDKYKNVDFDEIRNYRVRKVVNNNYEFNPFTIDLPVIKFTKENTPLKIGIDLIYYVDSAYNDKLELNAEFYQSELMILKNVRLDWGRLRGNCYYKGEIIGTMVDGISFYTKTKTGSVFGGPEILLGFGWVTTGILFPIIFPIEVVAGIANAGDGRSVFPMPLFE